MYKNTVTLFNYDETGNVYYPTLLSNVEFQPNYKTEYTSNSTRDKGITLLIVRYKIDSFGKIASGKHFVAPKIWVGLSIEDKAKIFTLKPGEYEFFIKGDYSSETDVNYEVFKNTYDDVFLIHGVKDFEDDLKHWEIEGA